MWRVKSSEAVIARRELWRVGAEWLRRDQPATAEQAPGVEATIDGLTFGPWLPSPMAHTLGCQSTEGRTHRPQSPIILGAGDLGGAVPAGVGSTYEGGQ